MRPYPEEPAIELDRPTADEPVDVLHFGRDPRQQPRWRRWLPLGIAVAVLVAGAAYQWRASGTPAAAPSRSASPTVTATPPPTTGPNTTDTGPIVTFIGHPLLGVSAGWELFGRSPDRIVRVELAAGRVTTTVVPTLQSGGAVSFLATPAGALIRPLDEVPGYLVADVQRPVALTGDLAHGGQVLPGPQPATVWISTGNYSAPAFHLVGLDGHPAGASVTVPDGTSGYLTGDGSGNLILLGTGGVYGVTPAGIQRVSGGELDAVGPTRYLVTECDEHAKCALIVIDKATGARRVIGPPLGRQSFTGVIDATGRTAALVFSNGGPNGIILVDLTSGRSRELPVSVTDDYQDGSIAWSPDGRWLFVCDPSGSIQAIDPVTNRPTPLGLSLPMISQVALRPAPTP